MELAGRVIASSVMVSLPACKSLLLSRQGLTRGYWGLLKPTAISSQECRTPMQQSGRVETAAARALFDDGERSSLRRKVDDG